MAGIICEPKFECGMFFRVSLAFPSKMSAHGFATLWLGLAFSFLARAEEPSIPRQVGESQSLRAPLVHMFFWCAFRASRKGSQHGPEIEGYPCSTLYKSLEQMVPSTKTHSTLESPRLQKLAVLALNSLCLRIGDGLIDFS